MQLELDFTQAEPVLNRPEFVWNATPFVPGCPRCEGWPDDNGLCWNHQNAERRAREHREPRVSQEEIDQDRGIIESMKRDLVDAAAAGRPMPWRESEDMTPLEKMDFQRRIFVAMRECGTVIVTAPTEEPKRKRR